MQGLEMQATIPVHGAEHQTQDFIYMAGKYSTATELYLQSLAKNFC